MPRGHVEIDVAEMGHQQESGYCPCFLRPMMSSHFRLPVRTWQNSRDPTATISAMSMSKLQMAEASW